MRLLGYKKELYEITKNKTSKAATTKMDSKRKIML